MILDQEKSVNIVTDYSPPSVHTRHSSFAQMMSFRLKNRHTERNISVYKRQDINKGDRTTTCKRSNVDTRSVKRWTSLYRKIESYNAFIFVKPEVPKQFVAAARVSVTIYV